jgi:hypothetical protein
MDRHASLVAFNNQPDLRVGLAIARPSPQIWLTFADNNKRRLLIFTFTSPARTGDYI